MRALPLLMSLLVVVACDDGVNVLFGEVERLGPLGPSGSAGNDPGEVLTPDASAPVPGGSGSGGSGSASSGLGGSTFGGSGPGGAASGATAGRGGASDDTDDPDAGAGPAPEVDSGEPAPVPPPPSDGTCGATCVRNGGRCFEGACVFDCDAPDSCNGGQVLCPPGRPCDVRCGDGSCLDNIVCGVLADCNISCEGKGSCADEVICEGQCEVTCSGAGSCGGGIGGSVELLELECSGADSCGSTVQCEGQECRISCSGPYSCDRVRMFSLRNSLDCSGEGSCASDIACYGGLCSVDCASGSCENGVECDAFNCDLPSLLDGD
jgi:hypothetical protein